MLLNAAYHGHGIISYFEKARHEHLRPYLSKKYRVDFPAILSDDCQREGHNRDGNMIQISSQQQT
jgi:hypothetical protein